MHKEIKHLTVNNLDYNSEQTFVEFTINNVQYIGKIGNKDCNDIVFTMPPQYADRDTLAHHKAFFNKDTMIELEILKVALEGGIFESQIHFEHAEGCKPPPKHFIRNVRNALIDEITNRFRKCYQNTIRYKKFNDKNPYTPLNTLN